MNTNLYKSIKECDAKACWPLVKDTIAIQLMGEDAIPVPFLVDAPHYDHCSLIVKESLSPMEKLQRKKTGIITVGHLKDFISNEKKSGLLNNMPKTRKASSTINPSYVFEESDLKNLLKKTVRVEIYNCERHVMENVPAEDSLCVDMISKGFMYVHKIYLVYEVFYADKVVVTVSINNETDRIEIDQKVPVGFKMRRYKLKEDGSLGETKDEPNKSNFQWIKRSHFRNPMDALPNPA